jgi:hypothetical protein
MWSFRRCQTEVASPPVSEHISLMQCVCETSPLQKPMWWAGTNDCLARSKRCACDSVTDSTHSGCSFLRDPEGAEGNGSASGLNEC